MGSNYSAKEGEEFVQWYEGQPVHAHILLISSKSCWSSKAFLSISGEQVRHTTVIIKTVNTLNTERVYEYKEIVKHQCVGYVQKRVVMHLKVKSNTAEPKAKILDVKKAHSCQSQGRGRRGRSWREVPCLPQILKRWKMHRLNMNMHWKPWKHCPISSVASQTNCSYIAATTSTEPT